MNKYDKYCCRFLRF